MSRWNANETCTTDLREALYLMGQNYKFVRLETIRSQTQFKFSPYFSFVFEGKDIDEARIRYLGNDFCAVDLTKFKVLAAEVESYMKSVEDYSI
jgi:hypothetical protein